MLAVADGISEGGGVPVRRTDGMCDEAGGVAFGVGDLLQIGGEYGGAGGVGGGDGPVRQADDRRADRSRC